MIDAVQTGKNMITGVINQLRLDNTHRKHRLLDLRRAAEGLDRICDGLEQAIKDTRA